MKLGKCPVASHQVRRSPPVRRASDRTASEPPVLSRQFARHTTLMLWHVQVSAVVGVVAVTGLRRR